jgi:hypothetical protein
MPYSPLEVCAVAEDWIEAWNAKDLDRIMGHYAVDIEFVANTVVRRWQKPDGKLRGLAELRDHFGLGLKLVPELHFEMESVFFAPSGYAVLYRRENGNRVLDVVELNSEGKARRVTAYYQGEQK